MRKFLPSQTPARRRRGVVYRLMHVRRSSAPSRSERCPGSLRNTRGNKHRKLG